MALQAKAFAAPAWGPKFNSQDPVEVEGEKKSGLVESHIPCFLCQGPVGLLAKQPSTQIPAGKVEGSSLSSLSPVIVTASPPLYYSHLSACKVQTEVYSRFGIAEMTAF